MGDIHVKLSSNLDQWFRCHLKKKFTEDAEFNWPNGFREHCFNILMELQNE